MLILSLLLPLTGCQTMADEITETIQDEVQENTSNQTASENYPQTFYWAWNQNTDDEKLILCNYWWSQKDLFIQEYESLLDQNLISGYDRQILIDGMNDVCHVGNLERDLNAN